MPHLYAAKSAHKLDALRLLPVQPAHHLTNVLAAADVLIATIASDAGAFAAPSKVLSYLCSGRPILLSAPRSNLAARIVQRANAGIVTDPSDETEFLEAAERLRADPGLRVELAANGRAYAERAFDIGMIADRFENVLLTASRNKGRAAASVPLVRRAAPAAVEGAE